VREQVCGWGEKKGEIKSMRAFKLRWPTRTYTYHLRLPVVTLSHTSVNLHAGNFVLLAQALSRLQKPEKVKVSE
jgi:hypothetical protein